jgi:hypothetical protein
VSYVSYSSIAELICRFYILDRDRTAWTPGTPGLILATQHKEQPAFGVLGSPQGKGSYMGEARLRNLLNYKLGQNAMSSTICRDACRQGRSWLGNKIDNGEASSRFKRTTQAAVEGLSVPMW